ncbi:helix-turn-helix domain-containing protein [Streptomyces globisporus]|uniref:helix-turn-helix domain-containing protein n=1 Tax=Streptomyces globisporus TaxID=1908 RepID=UPI0036FA4752
MPENPLYVEKSEQLDPLRPNELVSYNLLRARRARGWTQTQLGEVLGRHTGRVWSNASVSGAERAWQGGRSRKFDAEELVAFCHIFDVPLAYFLLPPEDSTAVEVATAEEEKYGALLRFPIVEYLKCILAVDTPPFFYARARMAVRESAGLEFQPAEWLGVAGGGNQVSTRAEGIQQIVDGENEAVLGRAERSRAAGERFDQWVREMGIPNEVVMDMTQARAEQMSAQVAAHLEQQGYLTEPQVRNEVQELRQQVNTLTRLLGQSIAGAEVTASGDVGTTPGVQRSFTDEEAQSQPRPDSD